MNPLRNLVLTQGVTSESEEVSEGKEERRELPSDWKVASVFEVGTEAFLFAGDWWESDGQNSIIADAEREDGTSLIFKRPKYTRTLWSDNLKKECYVARYLNSVGVGGVADCIAERSFSQEEVEKLLSSQGQHISKDYNGGEWHAIMLEQVAGESFMSTSISLGSQETEKRAVRNMLETASGMLRAGVVNVDQWHNILFDRETGNANFIDMESADFLTKAPLEVAKDAGEVLESKEHVFRDGQYRVETKREDQILSDEDGQRKAERMMSTLFGLIPKHAMGEADEALSSRVRTGDAMLDSAIDQAWQKHKDWVKSK